MENKFKKIDHIEISAGDTLIFATSKCPIEMKEALDEDITIQVGDTTTPCCISDFGVDNGKMCPYFESFIKSEK